MSINFSGNPEVDAQRYANKYNLTLDEAKNLLRAKYGEPTRPPVFSASSTNEDTFVSSKISSSSDTSDEYSSIVSESDDSSATTTVASGNTETATTVATTTDSSSSTKSKSGVREMKDKTLYKFLKREKGLSDTTIDNLSEDQVKKYHKELTAQVASQAGNGAAKAKKYVSNSSTTIDSSSSTSSDSSSSTKSKSGVREMKDKTLYRYLKNERGLSDDEIDNLSKSEVNKYHEQLIRQISVQGGNGNPFK